MTRTPARDSEAPVQKPVVLAEEGGSSEGLEATGVPETTGGQSGKTPPYPEDLLAKYRALTRKSWLGGLTADQEEELVSLRDQIQAISRRDERSQEAARQVKRVNAALAALEEEVDARIAERTAELAGTERAGAAE